MGGMRTGYGRFAADWIDWRAAQGCAYATYIGGNIGDWVAVPWNYVVEAAGVDARITILPALSAFPPRSLDIKPVVRCFQGDDSGALPAFDDRGEARIGWFEGRRLTRIVNTSGTSQIRYCGESTFPNATTAATHPAA